MNVQRDAVFATLLMLAVLASALAVVYMRHEGRKLFIDLQALQQVRDDMDVEWGQLQLEQSTWATHSRIDPIAREQLGMAVPDTTLIIKQGTRRKESPPMECLLSTNPVNSTSTLNKGREGGGECGLDNELMSKQP